jgi:ATP-dependent DNA helicase PIF1
LIDGAIEKYFKKLTLYVFLNINTYRMESLSPDQLKAFKLIESGKNIFVTGPGGTGKSHLIRNIVKWGKYNSKEVQVCALTGCAALLLECGAKTIHSWAGIGIASGPSDKTISLIGKHKYKSRAWRKVDILIIDEVSMMSKKIFDILDGIGRVARKCPTKPFGGIQIVLSGDFYQLPPVGDQTDPDTTSFCFESLKWSEAITETVELTTMFRQLDKLYVKALNQIRVGTIKKKSYDLLCSRVSLLCDGDIRPTMLIPMRRHAELINNKELAKLGDAESRTYSMENIEDNDKNKKEQPIKPTTQFDINEGNTTDNKTPIKQDVSDLFKSIDTESLNKIPITTEKKLKNPRKKMDDISINREYELLRNNVMADSKVLIKVGSQVMCIANIDMEGPFQIVNGSQGIVEKFVGDLPMVRFKDGQKRIIGYHTWNSENYSWVGVKQIPLIHAWAITIHKSQGVTLDLAEIDAGKNIFECGQTYVALSRVRSLEGLYLSAFDIKKIKVNKKVKKYYESIKIIS